MKKKLVAVWHRLTEPNSSLQDIEKRFQARLLLALMLFLMPLGFLGLGFSLLVKQDKSHSQIELFCVACGVIAILAILYRISRSKYYQLASYVSLAVAAVGILLIAWVDNTPEDLHAIYYLLILVMVSVLFLSFEEAVVFTAVILAVMLSIPLFIPRVTFYATFVGPFNFVFLASCATLLVAFYRSKMERSRQDELTNLVNESERRANQLTALHETSLDILSHRDIHELLQAITARAATLLNVSGGSIYLVNEDEETLTLTAVHGLGQNFQGAKVRYGEGLAGIVLKKGQPQIIFNYEQWPKRIGLYPRDLFSSVIQVPILSSGKVIGVLSCQEAVGVDHTFTDADIHLLEGLARQSAVALQTAYLLKEEQSARDRAERLQAATRALSSGLILQEVFETILVELQRVVPYDSASVQQLKNTHYLEIIGGHGFSNLEKILGIKFDLHSEDNPNRLVIETKQPILLDDAPIVYAGFNKKPHDKTVIHSWMGVPLLFDNEVIGMLALDKREIAFYTEEHAYLVSAFATQASIAIENARLYEETRAHAFELETLANISESLRTAKTIDDMLPILFQKTIEALRITYCVLYLVDQEKGDLVSRYAFPSGVYPEGLRQQVGVGITGHVAQTQEPRISEDVALDPRLSLISGEMDTLQRTKSAISVPLQTPDRLVGVLHLGSYEKRKFVEADVRLVTAVANIAANALNRAALTESLEQRVAERTQELAQANLRLQELDTLKSKFISDISHELRTPVATLSLYMDLLERGKPENMGKYMSVLRQKTDALVRLTEDILNTSRLKLYEGELEFTAVNLNQTIAIVIAMHRERAEAADIQLKFTPDPHLPPIRAERNQLMQAINNIVTNALNYTPSGSVQVSAYLLPDGRYICLEVTDTGIGIPADEIDHIFDRFYRGRQVAQSNVPGTGLGLTIVKEIVVLHRGAIEVESQPGEGSTFRIKWPLVRSP